MIFSTARAQVLFLFGVLLWVTVSLKGNELFQEQNCTFLSLVTITLIDHGIFFIFLADNSLISLVNHSINVHRFKNSKLFAGVYLKPS